MRKIQLRGNCAICGREQAVVNGKIRKHGYRKWKDSPSEACHGHQFPPMQIDITATKEAIIANQTKCEELAERAKKLENESSNNEQIQFLLTLSCFYRHVCEKLSKLMEEVHGKPLAEVDLNKKKSAPIKNGEIRITETGLIASVYLVEPTLVYWRDENGEIGRATKEEWRQFKLASFAVDEK